VVEEGVGLCKDALAIQIHSMHVDEVMRRNFPLLCKYQSRTENSLTVFIVSIGLDRIWQPRRKIVPLNTSKCESNKRYLLENKFLKFEQTILIKSLMGSFEPVLAA
jgi:hypothetical protein